MNANIINQRQPPPYSQNSKELLYTIASSSNNAFYACCTTPDTSNMFNCNNVIQTTNIGHFNSSNAIQTNISACLNENFLLKSLQSLPNFTAYPTNSLVISKENYQSPNKVIPQISMDTEAAIALRAARMVDMLAKENESLRKSLEQNERKLVQMQKLEMALENTQKGHDMLIQTNEKREQLERIVRTKLESENTLLKQQNIQLLEHVSLLQRENQSTAFCNGNNNNKGNLALGSQGNLTSQLTNRLLNLATGNHPDIVTNKTNSANDIAYAYGLNNVANRNRTNSTTNFGINNCNNHLIELDKKEVIISQLITQNREMLTLNEKKNFEVSTLKATLNEQTSQLEVLQKALLQAQTNVLRLEEIISSLADHFPPFIRKLLKDQLSLPQLDSANNQANCVAGDNINNFGGSPNNNLLLNGPHKSSSSVFKESLLGSHNSVESPHNNNNAFGRSWQNVAQNGIPNMLGMEDSLSTMRIYNTLITNNSNNCNQTNDFSSVGNQQPNSDTNLFTNFYYDYQDKLLHNQKGSSPQTILPPTTKHYLSHKPCSDTNLPSNLYELNNNRTNCFNTENQKAHNGGNTKVDDNNRNLAKNQELLPHLSRRTSCFVLPSNISKTTPYNINQSLSLNNFSEGVSIENAPKSKNVNEDLHQQNNNQLLGRNWEIRDKFQEGSSQFDAAQKEAMITELLNGTKFNTRRTGAPKTTFTTTHLPSYCDKNISAPNISLVDGSNNNNGILVNNNPKNGRYIKCLPFRTTSNNNSNISAANPLSPSSRLDLESIRKIFLPKTPSSSQPTSRLEPQTLKLVNDNLFSDIKANKVGKGGHRESLPPISPKYLGFVGKSPSSLTVSEVQNLVKETKIDRNGIMHKKQLTKSNLDILNSVSTQSQTPLTSSNNSSASSPGKKSKIMSFELKSRIWKI